MESNDRAENAAPENAAPENAAPADVAQPDVDDVKAKMREALERKKSHEHASAAGAAKVKGPHEAGAGQQRRVFRRKAGG